MAPSVGTHSCTPTARQGAEPLTHPDSREVIIMTAMFREETNEDRNPTTTPEFLALLKQGATLWNQWRQAHPDINPCLNRCDLRNLDLSHYNFSETDLIGADLNEANLKQANFQKADLCKAILKDADLYKVDLTGAILCAANLKGADLSRANLSGANLTGANLAQANLSEANLSGSHLDQVILEGAIFHNTTMPDGTVRGD